MSGGRPASRRDQVIEGVEWLAGYDHPDNLARRLGYKSGVSLVTRDYRTDSRRAA